MIVLSAKYFFVLGALLLFKMRKRNYQGHKSFCRQSFFAMATDMAGKEWICLERSDVSNKNFKILLLVKIFLTY